MFLKKSCLVIIAVVLITALFPATQTHAEEHYVNGVEGIKAATLPPPGIYWRMYNVYYHADELKDKNGNDVELSDGSKLGFDLDVYALVNRIIWVSKARFLGGNYFMDALIPLIYNRYQHIRQ